MKFKKWLGIIGVTAILSSSITFSSFAAWQQDSNGWSYQNDDGSYAKDEWKQIDNSWYYFDQNGYRLTGLQKLGFNHFYFEPTTGAMVTSATIQLPPYSLTFDKGGALLYQSDSFDTNPDHTLEHGYYSGSTYINSWADYKISFPENYEAKYFNSSIVKKATSVDLAAGTLDSNNYMAIYYLKMPDTNAYAPEELLALYADGISSKTGASKTSVVDKTFGGYTYKYVSCYTDSGVYTDYYCRIVNNNYMFIQNLYTDVDTMDALINSFTKAN